MKFESYHIANSIKKSLAELGFKRPTDIQFRAIPPILEGSDLLGIAQTGTGKTAAFVIPVLNKVLDLIRIQDEPYVKCLVMVPTRELALQIHEVFESIGKYTAIVSMPLIGGKTTEDQIEKLAKGVDVLIATPGRMFDLIYQKHLKITKVKILVCDEADQMLALGFNKDIQDVLKFLPKQHQTLFFSATINPTIKELAYALVTNPLRIQISPKDPISKNVDHSVAFIEMDDKRFFLERMIKEKETAKFMVFVRTKVRAERVLSALQRVQIEAVSIHGDKEQEEREKSLNAFKNGEVRILVATDISARGVDVAGVNYVVNYDLPEVTENYVHRIGRTGRGTARGYAVSFCSEEEKPLLAEIEKFITQPIAIVDIKKDDYSQTLAFSEETKNDWKSLLKEAEVDQQRIKDKGVKFKKGKQ